MIGISVSGELSREKTLQQIPQKISHMYIYIYTYILVPQNFSSLKLDLYSSALLQASTTVPSQCRVSNVAAAAIWLAAFGQQMDKCRQIMGKPTADRKQTPKCCSCFAVRLCPCDRWKASSLLCWLLPTKARRLCLDSLQSIQQLKGFWLLGNNNNSNKRSILI